MRIEVSIFDHEGNPRPWVELTQDLMEKVMVAGLAFYGNKSAACAAFKIGRSTQWRRTKPKVPARAKPAPLPAAKVIPAPAIVSDLGFLNAKACFDTAWPAHKDNQLRKLHSLKLSAGVIAAEMGCSTVTIERRLAKLGLRPSAYKLERENAL